LAAAALKGYEDNYRALKNSPYADFLGSGNIRRNEILAWKALAEGRGEEAVDDMRKAADEQDKVGQNEVDVPGREMLGDVLMVEHRPKEALVQYRVALQLSPNRLNTLLSAASAAEQAGLSDDARGYYVLVAKQTDKGADSQRPDVAHAVEAVATTVVR
jgi:tetratricopeptide (TPR) repeat protein